MTGSTGIPAEMRGLPRAMTSWRCGPGEVWTCGMGPRNAARWLEQGLGACRPGRLISAGYAGALDPALPLGQVLASWDPGFEAWPGVRPGRFHCSSRVAVTAREKAGLRAQTGADAVEMESGVIRVGCAQRKLPAATVRVISDTAGEDLPLDFGELLTRDDQLHFGKLAWRLICSPGVVPGLLRLQKSVRIAGDRLAEVLVRNLAPAGAGVRAQPDTSRTGIAVAGVPR